MAHCAGCRGAITTREIMNCVNCGSDFDLDCANLSLKRYYFMNQEFKETWKCPECRSAEPKKDNTNTPIGAAKPLSEDANNIKSRRKSSDDIPDERVISDDALKVIKTEIREALKSTLKNTLDEVVSEHFRKFAEKISTFENTLKYYNCQFEDIKKSLENKDNIIDKLQKRNENLLSTVKDLTGRISVVEQCMREANVEINGIPEISSENLENTLHQLAKTVDYPLIKGDVVSVIRVAKLNKESTRTRAVVAKFRNRTVRNNLLNAVKKFNKINSKEKLSSRDLGLAGARVPIYVSEHLSPSNKHLHVAARHKAKEAQYKYVWVRDGRVYARKNENSKILQIRSVSCLNLMN